MEFDKLMEKMDAAVALSSAVNKKIKSDIKIINIINEIDKKAKRGKYLKEKNIKKVFLKMVKEKCQKR